MVSLTIGNIGIFSAVLKIEAKVNNALLILSPDSKAGVIVEGGWDSMATISLLA